MPPSKLAVVVVSLEWESGAKRGAEESEASAPLVSGLEEVGGEVEPGIVRSCHAGAEAPPIVDRPVREQAGHSAGLPASKASMRPTYRCRFRPRLT